MGIPWHVEDDVFKFQVSLKSQSVTGQGICGTVGSVFDPLGFLFPVWIYCKAHSAGANYGLDEEITQALKKLCQKWITGLKKMEDFQIDRYQTKNIRMH